MGGFSADWLALREPLDHASINADLRRRLVTHFGGRKGLAAIDLGAGRGSNVAGLARWLPSVTSWTLLDYDQRLLDSAAARFADADFEPDVSFKLSNLATDALLPMFAGADLITSAAFFDLASQAVIERIADATVAANAAFYTVLTYDGLAAWFPEHAANGDMRRLFNAHQQTDKGMGPALGPAATDALARAFEQRGFHVARARSPWVIDARYGRLRHELDTGWAGAVRETGELDGAQIDVWLAARSAATGPVTIVGHEDLLALPPS